MGLFDRFFAKSAATVLHITSTNGFHLRPAAVFAAEAKKFSASIEAETRGQSVDAKNLNALLSLNLEKGDHFDIICKGRDAEEALEALTAVFETLMQSDKAVARIDKATHSYEGESFAGEIISQGVATAPLWRYSERHHKAEGGADFKTALERVNAALEAEYKANMARPEGTIFLAQRSLLETLSEETDTLEAFEAAVNDVVAALEGSAMAAKITDYRDLLGRVRSAMGYKTEVMWPDTPFVLLADDLLPSQVERLPQSVEGVVLQQSSLTSHTAILLRAAGVPSLIVREQIDETDTPVILDGFAGVLVADPSPKDLDTAKQLLTQSRSQKEQQHAKRFDTATTTLGKTIRILANVTDPASAKAAKEAGAEGIGLLRTEFLFQERKPTLQEQTEAYKAIFSLFDDVTVRTLDVGGDKALPYIDLPKEPNPFLGIRGVRLFESHPDLIAEQLKAIFTAAAGKPLKVMFPMVDSVESFTKAKTFAKEVAGKENIDISAIKFGMMVEVPSVLFLLPEFNEVVDFYSIGTNDLNQYLYAIERTHPTLALDPRSEALFRAVEKVAAEAEKPVSICGELAGDSEATARLVAAGIAKLSVSPGLVAQTKERIRHV